MLQLNSTTLCEALVPEPTLGSVNSRVSRMPLTVPIAPELRVETRSRSRSASVSRREGSAAPEMRNMASSGIALREQAAIERHLELACMAHAQPPATLPLSQRAPRPLESTACLPEADREAWIKAGLSAHDRGERARAMAREQREGAEASAKQRLCIFKPAVAPEAEAAGEAPTEKADAKKVPRAALATAEEHARRASGEAKAEREEAMKKDRARLCIFKTPTACKNVKQKDVRPAAPAMERVVRRSSRGAAEECAEPCPPAAQ